MKRPYTRRTREIHVYRERQGRRWAVASGGRRRSRHDRQATAVRMGRRLAKRLRVDLNIHGLNGRIREKSSHGNESRKRDDK